MKNNQTQREQFIVRLYSQIDKILFQRYENKDIPEKYKKRGIEGYFMTPKGTIRCTPLMMLSFSLTMNITSIMYRFPFYQIDIAAVIMLIAGIPLWIFTGMKFLFVIGFLILMVGHIEGFCIAGHCMKSQYDSAVIKVNYPENSLQMIRRYNEMVKDVDQHLASYGFNTEEFKTIAHGQAHTRYANMSSNEIKKEYRNLLKHFHPDNNADMDPEIFDYLKQECNDCLAYAKICEENSCSNYGQILDPQRFEDVENYI